jgi:hypothetical protein
MLARPNRSNAGLTCRPTTSLSITGNSVSPASNADAEGDHTRGAMSVQSERLSRVMLCSYGSREKGRLL